MAIVWFKRDGETHYEVRQAGRSIRLYTNGVFHTQWNPARPLSGHVWDLLFLGVLFHSTPSSLDKVCILGVGGGAVINALNAFLKPRHIKGIDLDPTHLDIAERFFKAKASNVSFVEKEASEFVRSSREAFDVLVEDIFIDGDEGATRAIACDKNWLLALRKRLNRQGVLIMNFDSLSAAQSQLKQANWRACGFSSLHTFTLPRYENAIVCLSRQKSTHSLFNENVKVLRRIFGRAAVWPVSITLKTFR